MFQGLFYICLLFIVFKSKKRIVSEENKLFNILAIVSIIVFITEIFLQLSIRFIGGQDFYSMVLARSFLIELYIWFCIFSIYTYYITRAKKIDSTHIRENKYRFFKRIISVFVIIGTILYTLLPIKIMHEGETIYSYGTSVDLLKLSLGAGLLFWLILLVINRKDIKRKEFVPIYTVVLFLIINVILQTINPSVVIASSLMAFNLFIMFFTIENPDVKMLEQVEIAKEQADKANAAKTDFLSSMSHEIRTPLNAIVGFSDLVSEAKTLDEAKTNAKDIVNASQTLLEIVNGILDISKIEAGKLEIKESPYNAKEIFEDLAKLIRPRMDEKGLDFTYYIAPDIPTTLYGDHANIKKIVTNFLSNAAKYTEKGYVKYEVNCINNNGVCKLIVSVEDSGRGIKKESVNKLFEKFDRLDVERNTTVEGTGLGLAITKQLVEMMGGKIIVHTVYGEGSKFTVMLDQKIETTQVVETEKVADTLDLSGVDILLVDDNDLNLKVGSKLLEKFNADRIDLAKNGFECIDKVRDNKYDLILLDDMMPKKSGTETLKELKALPNFNTPTVALTANAIAGMREAYMAAGFDEYLAKPIERQDLIKVVNKLLKDKLSNEEVKETAQQIESPQEIKVPLQEQPQPDTPQQVETPIQEEKHVVDNVLPTNATEVPTEDTNTIIENPTSINNPIQVDNQIPIPVEPTKDTDEEFLRKRGVDMDKALELLGDMEMYNMTMEDFSKELENKWSKLEQEKLQNDMENYAIDVHSLKSDCKYLGFYDLADVAYEHELKSKENDSNFVNENFERLANEYLKVLNIVKEYKDRLK